MSNPKVDLVAHARLYAAEQKSIFSPMRQRTLVALIDVEMALSAYALANKVGEGKPGAAVQVYRALDFLQKAGVVRKLTSRNAFIACKQPICSTDSASTVFLLCTECDNVEQLLSPSICQDLGQMAAQNGFIPHSQIIEIEGRCARHSQC